MKPESVKPVEKGDVYICLDDKNIPTHIRLSEKGEEGFSEFITDVLPDIKPNEELPVKLFIHYEFPNRELIPPLASGLNNDYIHRLQHVLSKIKITPTVITLRAAMCEQQLRAEMKSKIKTNDDFEVGRGRRM